MEVAKVCDQNGELPASNVEFVGNCLFYARLWLRNGKQVFCITHLPQIAARGTDHYRVRKSVNGGRTMSSITILSEQDREQEVARMLAGDSATEQTRAWARELLSKDRAA